VSLACRKSLVHRDNNYMRYRQITGISMFTMEGIAIGLWVQFGLSAFALAMLVACGLSLAMMEVYELQLARDERGKELDEGVTVLLSGATAALAIATLILRAVGL